MTIMTNCLTSKGICYSLLRDQERHEELGTTLNSFNEQLVVLYEQITQNNRLLREKENVNIKLLIRQVRDLDNEVMLGQYLLAINDEEQKLL